MRNIIVNMNVANVLFVTCCFFNFSVLFSYKNNTLQTNGHYNCSSRFCNFGYSVMYIGRHLNSIENDKRPEYPDEWHDYPINSASKWNYLRWNTLYTVDELVKIVHNESKTLQGKSCKACPFIEDNGFNLDKHNHYWKF